MTTTPGKTLRVVPWQDCVQIASYFAVHQPGPAIGDSTFVDIKHTHTHVRTHTHHHAVRSETCAAISAVDRLSGESDRCVRFFGRNQYCDGGGRDRATDSSRQVRPVPDLATGRTVIAEITTHTHPWPLSQTFQAHNIFPTSGASRCLRSARYQRMRRPATRKRRSRTHNRHQPPCGLIVTGYRAIPNLDRSTYGDATTHHPLAGEPSLIPGGDHQ